MKRRQTQFSKPDAAGWRLWLLVGAISILSPGCHPSEAPKAPDAATPPPLPWQQPKAQALAVSSRTIALVGGRVLTAAGRDIPDGTVVMQNGRILAVGPRPQTPVPEGAESVDARGKVITPGLIDAHSHMGVYPQPQLRAHADGNEATAPVTAQVQAADSFWPQDPSLSRAVAGGITSILVLPGSANLIGGRGATLKLHPSLGVDGMRFPGAPETLKMACGENPKRVYGERNSAPSTRMGNVAGYRAAYQQALEYGTTFKRWQKEAHMWQQKQNDYQQALQDAGEDAAESPEDPGPAPTPPSRDLGLETLLGVLNGDILVQMHCYRADEMLNLMKLAKQYGFQIRAFHHAVEAYKIRHQLAAQRVGVATWADWWGFKIEAFDTVPETLGLLTRAGVRGAMHSDSPIQVQHLNQEAAKAMFAARRSGIQVTEQEALAWITTNPAWLLGVESQTGSLEVGKMADVVMWSGSPFSVYTMADRVYVDGILRFDRNLGPKGRSTDFEVGLEEN